VYHWLDCGIKYYVDYQCVAFVWQPTWEANWLPLNLADKLPDYNTSDDELLQSLGHVLCTLTPIIEAVMER